MDHTYPPTLGGGASDALYAAAALGNTLAPVDPSSYQVTPGAPAPNHAMPPSGVPQSQMPSQFPPGMPPMSTPQMSMPQMSMPQMTMPQMHGQTCGGMCPPVGTAPGQMAPQMMLPQMTPQAPQVTPQAPTNDATGCQYCVLWQQQVQMLQQQNAQQAVELQSLRMQSQALVQQQSMAMLSGQGGGAPAEWSNSVASDYSMSAGMMGPPGPPGQPAGPGAGFFNATPEENPFHKTTLCKRYTSPGGCSFGEKCNFAHGAEEIRQKPPLGAKSVAESLGKRQRDY